jgi:hypothetical protein
MLSEMLDAAYAAHIEVHLARRERRRSKRAEYEAAEWMQEILPAALLESEGIDVRVAVLLCLLDLSHKYRGIEARVANRLGYGSCRVSGAYETFQSRIITSAVLLWLDAWLWALPRLSRTN